MMKYSRNGITEQKKAELDQLKTDVTNAQYLVNELQANVTSLGEKSAEFNDFLNTAQADEQTALINLDLVKSVVNTVKGLEQNAKLVMNQTQVANEKVKLTARNMTTMIEQLIFSADIVDKLAKLIDNKKSLNQLISDELVTTVTLATKDANVAVSASLTALKSCFAALATTEEAHKITMLGAKQGDDLYQTLTGTPVNVPAREYYAIEAHNELNDISDCINLVTIAEQGVSFALDGGVSSGKSKSANLKEIQSEISQLEPSISKATDNIVTAEKTLNQATTSLTKAQQKSADTKKALTLPRQNLASLQEKLTTDKQLVDSLTEQVGVAAGTAKTKLQTKLKTSQETLANSQKAIETAQKTLTPLEKENKTAQQALVTSEAEISNAQESLNNSKVLLKTLEAKLAKAITALDIVQNPIPDVKAAEQSYNSAIVDLDDKQEALHNVEADLLHTEFQLSIVAANTEQQEALLTQKKDQTNKIEQLHELIHNSQLEVARTKGVLEKSQNLLQTAELSLNIAVKGLDEAMNSFNQIAQSQQNNALYVILGNAYIQAKHKFWATKKANDEVTKELDSAQNKLIKATNKLNSLKAGLDAAQAAALAA